MNVDGRHFVEETEIGWGIGEEVWAEKKVWENGKLKDESMVNECEWSVVWLVGWKDSCSENEKKQLGKQAVF